MEKPQQSNSPRTSIPTFLKDFLKWNLRKVNNVHPDWYIKVHGCFCSQCKLAYDFVDSYKSLLECRAKGQLRGPRCIRCGKILRTRSKPNPISGFWNNVEDIEGIKISSHEDDTE